jgi:chemotaxis protein histidine kinase CheA
LLDLLFDGKDQMRRLIQGIANARRAGQSDATVEADGSLLAALADALVEPPVPQVADDLVDQPLGQILSEQNILDEPTLMAALKSQKDSRPPLLGDILVQQGMAPRRLVDDALRKQQEGTQEPVGALLLAERQVCPEDLQTALDLQHSFTKPKLGEVLVRNGQAAASDVRNALKRQQSRTGGTAGVSESSPRDSFKVEAHRLDQLVETIGELVIAESMVVQHPDLKLLPPFPGTSPGCSAQLDKISRDLQEMATDLRLVSIRPVFDKMARLARDLSRKTSKPLRFHMEGEETMLDKNVVDRIGDLSAPDPECRGPRP